MVAGIRIYELNILSFIMESIAGKRILVTGGAGFVGSNLVKALVQQWNARVTVLDDLFTGSLNNLTGVQHEFILGSVEDSVLVNECIRNVDIVFHLASRNIIISNKNPREDLNVNVKGSFNVFEACLKHKIERVIYTSTSSIYGDPETIPVLENSRKKFLNFYSASKFSAEVYANTFFEVFHLPVTILRYSNVYGINQAPVNPYCGVVGKFIEAAVTGNPLKVHGNGEQTRDYTYIDDAVSATIAAAVHKEAIGEDYNIGTGKETSVSELAEAIIHITKSSSVIEHINNRDIDNISRRCINIEKARKQLHFEPKNSLEKGLMKTVNWFAELHAGTALNLLIPSAIV